MKLILKVIIIVILIAIVGYIGICVKANILDKRTAGAPPLPKMNDAQYTVLIENTRQFYLTSQFDQYGQEVGKRVFVLHGFWQVSGNKYVYVSGDSPPLDEAVFGKMTITRRAK